MAKAGIVSPVLLALFAALTAAGPASTGQDSGSSENQPREAPAGEGVLCLFALTQAAAEVGRQCHAGDNPAVQAELDDAVVRFEAYLLSNSNATPADVARFEREQGFAGAGQDRLCHGDPLRLYENFAAQGPQALRRQVDTLLARQGPPTWGDCL
jgi:hypothetical protein